MTSLEGRSDVRALMRFVLQALEVEDDMASGAGHGYQHLGLSPSLNAGWTVLDGSDNVRPSYDARLVRALSPDRVKAEVRLKRAQVVALARAIDADEPTETLVALVRSTAALWPNRDGFDPAWAADEMWEADSPGVEEVARVLALGSYEDTPLNEMSERDAFRTRLDARKTAPLLA